MRLKFIVALFISLIATSALADEGLSEQIVDTHKFSNIAIQEMTITKSDGNQVANKVLVSHYTKNLNKKSGLNLDDNQTIDSPFWIIEAKDLPAEHACIQNMLDDCKELNEMGDLYQGVTCNHCLIYGANFLTFNEQTQKLYLMADVTDMGSEDGHVMIFEADINSKTIQYLGAVEGPLHEAVLSPDNKFIALSARNWITVLKLHTEDKSVVVANNEPKGNDEIYHLTDNIKWINNTQFTFNDSETMDNLSGNFDKITSRTYDVEKKAVVSSVVLKNK